MKRAHAIALLLGFGALACNQAESDSVVVVSVSAPVGLLPIMKLQVTASNGASHSTVYFPQQPASSPIDFSSEVSFALTLPRSRAGEIDIVIDGLDAVGNVVAHGEGSVAIAVGGQASVTVALAPGAGLDGGPGPEAGVDADRADVPLPGDTGAGGATGGTDGRIGGTGGTSADAAGAGGRIDGSGVGGVVGTGGAASDAAGAGGRLDGGMGGRGGAGGTGGGAPDGPGVDTPPPPASTCGNGKVEPGERCDCGNDPSNLPSACKAVNGLFYGDGKGCSKTCTAEPTCLDSSGKTQACTTTCGDGNVDPGEACDDGNGLDGDGCSSKCVLEDGFNCSIQTVQDLSTCQSGTGQCLQLPVIYRDFQPENVASGGHPDFPFLGTRYNGSKSPTTICVPNSAGPGKGNDSTARCWGVVGDALLNGKPQPGPTTTCACRFSDWSVGNSPRIPSGYTAAANDSPLSDGNGGYLGGSAGTTVNTTSSSGAYKGNLIGFTASTPGGPMWSGTVPAYKNAASFNQWWNDDSTVNKTFTGVLELTSISYNLYQYASQVHLADGGFFPLDTLNPSQATLCNLWPYWNHGNGQPIWGSCQGDQYLFPPYVTSADCAAAGDTVDDGCWVTGVRGVKHNSYFTDEVRFHFVYDGASGMSVSFYGDDELFIFINGVLVLDLGGIHQQLPGKVTVSGDPGDAHVVEGGCVDAAGSIVGTSVGSTVCSPGNVTPKLAARTPEDFRDRTVKLGLQTGKVYEMAIFGTDRHPPGSNFQLSLQGFTTKRSTCVPK